MHDHTTGVTVMTTGTTRPADLSLGARIDALDDEARKAVLHYLTGYAPEAVQMALGEIGA